MHWHSMHKYKPFKSNNNLREEFLALLFKNISFLFGALIYIQVKRNRTIQIQKLFKSE